MFWSPCQHIGVTLIEALMSVNISEKIEPIWPSYYILANAIANYNYKSKSRGGPNESLTVYQLVFRVSADMRTW